MSHLQRIYNLYREWGHGPVSAYIEARKYLVPTGHMFWFFLLMLDQKRYHQ